MQLDPTQIYHIYKANRPPYIDCSLQIGTTFQHSWSISDRTKSKVSEPQWYFSTIRGKIDRYNSVALYFENDIDDNLDFLVPTSVIYEP